MKVQQEAAAPYAALIKAVYADDLFYIPEVFQPETDVPMFFAYENNSPVACCTAQLQTGNPAVGTIGDFVALNNREAATAVLRAAAEHLKGQKVDRVLGPLNGDTWHSYRLNTGPYEAAPFIKEPWNPAYYPSLWLNADFIVAETYDSYLVENPAVAANDQEKFYRRCIRNGYRFESIHAGNYERMLPEIYRMSCSIFTENKLYTEILEAEFIAMYSPAKALLGNGLSWIGYAPDGAAAGYIFTFPDYADAVRSMNGSNGFMARLRFLRNKKRATRTCIKTLGSIPEKRGSGLTAALTYLSYKNSVDLGFGATLMCLMHSSNDSRRFGGHADRPFRSYALYEYAP